MRSLLDWPNRFWSIGPSASYTIFDGGLRRATANQYIAEYNSAVAAYRQSVLTAFQQVEDSLAGVRILSQQAEQEDQAVQSAQKYVTLEMNRYNTGIDPYVDVVTAQNTLLSNQQTQLTVQIQEITSAVQLIARSAEDGIQRNCRPRSNFEMAHDAGEGDSAVRDCPLLIPPRLLRIAAYEFLPTPELMGSRLPG